MTLNEIVNMHLELLINGFPVNFNGNIEREKKNFVVDHNGGWFDAKNCF